MIKRVSILATSIKVEDGCILQMRPGLEPKNLIPNTPNNIKYRYTLSTETMIPKEHFSFMAAGNVCINTLSQDENEDFYDLGQTIVTDKLISITVRQYIVANIYNLNKEVKKAGFCLLDIAF